MSHRILISLSLVGMALALNPIDALACGGRKKILTAAEQARSEQAFEAARKKVQAQNITAIDKALSKTKISRADRSRVKELRDDAAKLGNAGKLDDANRALREAWKMLGHPELYAVVARPRC